jgi:chromatin segregation and condensation protein Rec8/ScpA/Scc1 (kleisin family)
LSEDVSTEYERPFWIRPPWKVLFDLVQLHTVRPWDVNLTNLLTSLLKEMGGKGYIDFSASGIALLSSAIIYRMKSEQILELQEPPKPPPEKVIAVLPPPIQLPYRFEYTSTTVDNLVDALEEILEDKTFMESQPEPPTIAPEPFVLRNLDDFMIDIERKIEDMFGMILVLAEKSEVIRFSTLVQGIKRRDTIRRFLLVLFLASRGSIQLWQDEEFGEMYIRLSQERGFSNDSNTKE